MTFRTMKDGYAIGSQKLLSDGSGEKLILHLESRAVLRPHLPLVVEPGRRNVRVPKPLLHLGNVSAVFERGFGLGMGRNKRNFLLAENDLNPRAPNAADYLSVFRCVHAGS